MSTTARTGMAWVGTGVLGRVNAAAAQPAGAGDAPRHTPASLQSLLTSLERWSDLKDLYGHQVELAQTGEDKKNILFQMADTYDTRLKDIEHAIETYNDILGIDPTDIEALRALDRLYGRAERWYDLLQILEREVELSQTSAETVVFKHRIGKLFERGSIAAVDLPKTILRSWQRCRRLGLSEERTPAIEPVPEARLREMRDRNERLWRLARAELEEFIKG